MTKALVFDSGVGGLSVSLEIRERLPDLTQYYVADDIFRPYGEKTEKQLRDRLPGLLRTLEIMLDPDIIVIACNTASTTALPHIRRAVSVPVVGVVPAIKPAARQSQTKVIGVLGTPGTVRRDYVDQLIVEFASDCEVLLHGNTQIVQMAEDKLSGKTVSTSQLSKELAPLFEQAKSVRLDHVVLACTHFPLIREELTKAAPYDMTWVDSGSAIARRVDALLKDKTTSRKDSDTAFIIGTDINSAKRAAFRDFGFDRLVSLPG